MIKLTPMHYTFWMEHTTRTPSWAVPWAAKRSHVSIHELINTQVEGKRRRNGGADPLHIVRMRRKNGDSIADALEPSDWCKHNVPERYFQMRRWKYRHLRSMRTQFLSDAEEAAQRR